MSDNRLYPPHIYDPIRQQIAVELLQKELRKFFPHLPEPALPDFNRDIAAWPTGDKAYKLNGVLDFWDIVEAVFGGFKLKPLVHLLTAANITWRKTTVAVQDITLTAPLDQLRDVPGFTENRLALPRISELLAQHPEVKTEQRATIKTFLPDPQQNAFPIICLQKGTSLKVLDGNRRALHALLHDQPTIQAWLGTSDSRPPQDYWIPLQEMMTLVRGYKTARRAHNATAAQAYQTVLASYFAASSVARIAYRERVNTDRYARELAKGLL